MRGIRDVPPTRKGPAPSLSIRMPPPPAVRIKPAAAAAVVLAATLLIGGALVWGFVVRPDLRAGARAEAMEPKERPAAGEARPSEVVTAQPARYDRLRADNLPPPRVLGTPDAAEGPRPGAGRRAAASRPPPPSADRRVRLDLAAQARASDLFVEIAAETPARPPAPDALGQAPTASPPVSVAAGNREVYNPHGLTAPQSPYEVKAGDMLQAALVTAVDTSRPGPAVAVITAPAFDTLTGEHLLVPQGARLIGRAEGGARYGDKRAVLVWTRLLLPNGKSLLLQDEIGVDPQGASGVPAKADRRLASLALATLFAGAITTVGEMARDEDDEDRSLLGSAGDAAAIQAAQVGGRLVERELQVAPTLRLEPGAPVGVLITRDLILEPYTP